jgi:hypothetical protein
MTILEPPLRLPFRLLDTLHNVPKRRYFFKYSVRLFTGEGHPACVVPDRVRLTGISAFQEERIGERWRVWQPF